MTEDGCESLTGIPEGARDGRLMALAALAALAGAFVQSATGFGFALVLSPALFAVLEPDEAVTTLLALGLALNVLVLFEHGRPRARGLARARAGAGGGRCPGWRRPGGAHRSSPRRRFRWRWAWRWCSRPRGSCTARSRRGAARLARGGWVAGLRERRAHHLDQRERAADGALARGARDARRRSSAPRWPSASSRSTWPGWACCWRPRARRARGRDDPAAARRRAWWATCSACSPSGASTASASSPPCSCWWRPPGWRASRRGLAG